MQAEWGRCITWWQLIVTDLDSRWHLEAGSPSPRFPPGSSYQPLLTLILDILVDEMGLPGSGALTQVLSDMTRLDRWRDLRSSWTTVSWCWSQVTPSPLFSLSTGLIRRCPHWNLITVRLLLSDTRTHLSYKSCTCSSTCNTSKSTCHTSTSTRKWVYDEEGTCHPWPTWAYMQILSSAQI